MPRIDAFFRIPWAAWPPVAARMVWTASAHDFCRALGIVLVGLQSDE